MGVISNVIKTVFTSSGANNVVKDTETVARSQTRLGQASASASRQFAAQSQGLGGLVAAYAGAAATVFALQAAFTALDKAARFTQTLEGLNTLASGSGIAADAILTSVQNITKGQLTIAETAEQINLAISAGFNTKQIEGLASVSLKASRALGRDFTDAMTRVVRGSAKMESELLDELGIYAKIGPATTAYAAAIGKGRLELTEYERRQAFVNAVIAEGNAKFKDINVTVPTAAEEIQKFGANVSNLVTSLGSLLAQVLVPLVSFFNNNVAAAFGVVGLAASLAAAKGVSVLRESLNGLAETAKQKAAAVEDFFLKYDAAAIQARDTAQKSVSSISLVKGLIGGEKETVKTLREAAKTRTLTGTELAKINNILAERVQKVTAMQQAEEATGRQLQEERSRLQQLTATYAANSSELAAHTKLLEQNEKKLKTNVSSQANSKKVLEESAATMKLLQKASESGASKIANFSSTVVEGFYKAGGAIANGAASLVDFGSRALGVISILSVLGSSIAGIVGLTDEYNALLSKAGTVLKNFFTSVDTQKIKQSVTSIAADTLESLQKTDARLQGIEEFKFSSKILGVNVELTKTKEDIVKEVTTAITDAEQLTNKTIGERLKGESSVIGGGIGLLIGSAAGKSAAGFLAARGSTGIGAAIGTAIAPGLGTVIGAGLGLAIGVGLDYAIDTFSSKGLSEDQKSKLSAAYGADIFSGTNVDLLERALIAVEEQAGAYKDLSIQGRLYYETLQKTTIETIKNVNNFRDIQQIAENLGISAADVKNQFKIIGDTITSITSNSVQVPISFKLVDEQSLLQMIDNQMEKLTKEAKPIVLSVDTLSNVEPLSNTTGQDQQITNSGVNAAAIEAYGYEMLNAVNSGQELQMSLLKITSFANDFEKALMSGSLTLEQYSQRQGQLNSLIAEQTLKLDRLKSTRSVLSNMLVNNLGIPAAKADEYLQYFDDVIAKSEINLRNVTKNKQAILDVSNGLRQQLVIADTLEKAYGNMGQELSTSMGQLTTTGSIVFNQDQQRLLQLREITNIILDGQEALKAQQEQASAVESLNKSYTFSADQLAYAAGLAIIMDLFVFLPLLS